MVTDRVLAFAPGDWEACCGKKGGTTVARLRRAIQLTADFWAQALLLEDFLREFAQVCRRRPGSARGWYVLESNPSQVSKNFKKGERRNGLPPTIWEYLKGQGWDTPAQPILVARPGKPKGTDWSLTVRVRGEERQNRQEPVT
eukprot:s1087_g4.t1